MAIKRPIKTKKLAGYSIAVFVCVAIILQVYVLLKPFSQNQTKMTNHSPAKLAPEQEPDRPTTPTAPKPDKLRGEIISVGGSFKIIVPNGWKASVSTNPTFLAVQFGRPNTINTLHYNTKRTPKIDYNGIPSWSGLTEHFYIRDVSAAGKFFKPSDHAEVTSKSFLFDDGTKGKKYSVTKYTTEAQAWGGLQKDNKWYGRVYVY
ncbi:MAG TPA: hypothetical protein VGE13_04460, partial [Candidatus Saccharimonadales bacterium]